LFAFSIFAARNWTQPNVIANENEISVETQLAASPADTTPRLRHRRRGKPRLYSDFEID
jgi:hypothetical protein